MAVSPTSERITPRLSANDMALYMVSSDTARVGILRRAKYPQPPPIIRYRDARSALCAYLSATPRNLQALVVAEALFRQRLDDPATGPLLRDDAAASIAVLYGVQRMANQLGAFTFSKAPDRLPYLHLAGVDISVRLDLLTQSTTRGKKQVGGAILRMTQDDAVTDTARQKRREMGTYVATLVRMQIEQNLQADDPIANRLCMSIDVQHGEVFQARDNSTRRMNDLENACTFIAAVWEGL